MVRAAAGALSAPATSIGFLPAARMSFMPGMRGSATSGVTEMTAGSSTSTTSVQSSRARVTTAVEPLTSTLQAAVTTGQPSFSASCTSTCCR